MIPDIAVEYQIKETFNEGSIKIGSRISIAVEGGKNKPLDCVVQSVDYENQRVNALYGVVPIVLSFDKLYRIQ